MLEFRRFLDLLYPPVCASCKRELSNTELPICISCILNLPVIINDTVQQEKIMQKFDGKVNINNAKSYLLFQKGNVAQRIIYDLKYRNNQKIGIWVGKKFGEELKNVDKQDEINLILPVPLHETKQKQRGYNQAEMIAKGISEALKIPVVNDGLIKIQHTSSQTKKNRYERYLNTVEIFSVNSKFDLSNKSIYLVDDVLTTGATLEAAAQELIEIGCSVYIRTIASAL